MAWGKRGRIAAWSPIATLVGLLIAEIAERLAGRGEADRLARRRRLGAGDDLRRADPGDGGDRSDERPQALGRAGQGTLGRGRDRQPGDRRLGRHRRGTPHASCSASAGRSSRKRRGPAGAARHRTGHGRRDFGDRRRYPPGVRRHPLPLRDRRPDRTGSRPIDLENPFTGRKGGEKRKSWILRIGVPILGLFFVLVILAAIFAPDRRTATEGYFNVTLPKSSLTTLAPGSPVTAGALPTPPAPGSARSNPCRTGAQGCSSSSTSTPATTRFVENILGHATGPRNRQVLCFGSPRACGAPPPGPAG